MLVLVLGAVSVRMVALTAEPVSAANAAARGAVVVMVMTVVAIVPVVSAAMISSGASQRIRCLLFLLALRDGVVKTVNDAQQLALVSSNFTAATYATGVVVIGIVEGILAVTRG